MGINEESQYSLLRVNINCTICFNKKDNRVCSSECMYFIKLDSVNSACSLFQKKTKSSFISVSNKGLTGNVNLRLDECLNSEIFPD